MQKNNVITQRYNAIFINQVILVLFYHYFISLFHKWLKFNVSAISLLHFNVWRCYFKFSQNQCHNFNFFLSKNRLIPNKIGVSHVIPRRPHVQSSSTPVVSIILVINSRMHDCPHELLYKLKNTLLFSSFTHLSYIRYTTRGWGFKNFFV